MSHEAEQQVQAVKMRSGRDGLGKHEGHETVEGREGFAPLSFDLFGIHSGFEQCVAEKSEGRLERFA